jgi:hypothetical protein
LEDVKVEMEEPDGFTVLSQIPIPKLGYDQPATTYTLVELTDPNTGGWGHGEGERGRERGGGGERETLLQVGEGGKRGEMRKESDHLPCVQ